MEKGEYSRAYMLTDHELSLVAMALTKMFLQATDNEPIRAELTALMTKLYVVHKGSSV